tara:strand:- start:227 stop:724 length:498 start_codon:yes stop_codon:yes gene_type:complete
MQKTVQIIFISFIIIKGNLLAHCQVPCGIYDDALRVISMHEDFETINKAMNEINQLQQKSEKANLNQIVRWINTKEEHATRIQKTISEYFLIQRVKVKNNSDKSAYSDYTKKLETLHQLMVIAMKCKQNISQEHVNKGKILLDKFTEIYFDDHGIKHLKAIKNTL